MQSVFEFPIYLAARGGKDPPPEWVILLFLWGSVVLAVTAIYLGLRVKKRLATAIRVEGEVIGLLEKADGRHVLKAPVMRFTAGDGSTHVVESEVFIYPAAFEIGQRIRVVYPPDKPEKAEYVGLFAQWGVVMIAGGVAVALGIMGLAFRYLEHLANG